ncbi:hypothetical protein B0H15DRAFT_1023758 [Mycena belliarum]|uniref:Uncharacterized protein n=1 Tax=Mycena belliarum TaxID=1033014 RepID=A0AAD6XME6_9AGAR|nr:hypothetical protein B0H15DRAFT_1023758 [Mycena belliae]
MANKNSNEPEHKSTPRTARAATNPFVKPEPGHRSRSATTELEPDDETASNHTDFTELSTTAQAGSLAPSPTASPVSAAFSNIGLDKTSPATDDYGEESHPGQASRRPTADSDGEDRSAPSPPKLNLAPRTHPLGDGDAAHGGILLRESVQAQMDAERAQGVLSPGYEGTGPHAENMQNGEDDYSSDEGRDVQEGKAKGLVKRLKGEAKVISGKILRNPERVEEGKNLKGGA